MSNIARCLLFLTTLAAACHAGLDDPDRSPDGGVACASIKSQTECAARQDCVADTCNACGCSVTFVGCRAQSAAPTKCPDINCPAQICCHNDSDCMGEGECLALPIIEGCPLCNANSGPSSCQTDSDCATGQVCDPTPCTCGSPPTMSCLQGCASDADCPEPETCGSNFRCQPAPCDASCTGNYTCGTNPANTCTRKPCQKDADCGQPGYCIDNLCSHGLGECVILPV